MAGESDWRRIPAGRRAGCLALVLGALALGGCTVLHIQSADGQVRVEHRLGLLIVEPSAGQQAMLLSSRTLGWQGGPAGGQLGLSSARLVMLPDGCRVIVWADAPLSAPPSAASAASGPWAMLREHTLCQVANRGEP